MYLRNIRELKVGALIPSQEGENYHHFDLTLELLDRTADDSLDENLDGMISGWLFGDEGTLRIRFAYLDDSNERFQDEAVQALNDWAKGRFELRRDGDSQ